MKKNVNENEIWVDIVDYEGLYQVSNLGRVKSLKDRYNNPREKILKPQLTNGYYRICLSKNHENKWYLVHRLVAIAFIPNPNNLPIINHKNEIRNDNRVENLEWCTPKYNSNYGTAIERRLKNLNIEKMTEKLKNNKLLSKPILQLDLEGKAIAEFPSIMEAERQTGFMSQNINKCLKGKIKTAYGYIWKYKED